MGQSSTHEPLSEDLALRVVRDLREFLQEKLSDLQDCSTETAFSNVLKKERRKKKAIGKP